MPIKKCKKCENDRYANTSWCITHFKEHEKEKADKKKLKIKKTTKVRKKSSYQKECDALYQEIGRIINDKCLVCGGVYSCLHHFIRKSQSTALRYDFDNGIPICNVCHCRIHAGQDSATVAKIVAIKGIQWFEMIDARKRLGLGLNYGISWYKEQIDILKTKLKQDE